MRTPPIDMRVKLRSLTQQQHYHYWVKHQTPIVAGNGKLLCTTGIERAGARSVTQRESQPETALTERNRSTVRDETLSETPEPEKHPCNRLKKKSWRSAICISNSLPSLLFFGSGKSSHSPFPAKPIRFLLSSQVLNRCFPENTKKYSIPIQRSSTTLNDGRRVCLDLSLAYLNGTSKKFWWAFHSTFIKTGISCQDPSFVSWFREIQVMLHGCFELELHRFSTCYC
jgi:hypothetical protein